MKKHDIQGIGGPIQERGKEESLKDSEGKLQGEKYTVA